MRKSWWVLGIVSAVVLSASQARADSEVFWFWMTGNGEKASSFHYSDDGLTMDVTGGAYDGGVWHDAKYLGRWSGGTGIQNSTGDNKHTVDGSGWKDVLDLSFNQTVTLTKLYFGYVSRGQDYVEILSGDHSASWGTYALQGGGSTKYVDLAGEGITGSAFGLKAPGKYDSWKVKKVKGQTHVVPTPAAGTAGLLCLALVAARRRWA